MRNLPARGRPFLFMLKFVKLAPLQAAETHDACTQKTMLCPQIGLRVSSCFGEALQMDFVEINFVQMVHCYHEQRCKSACDAQPPGLCMPRGIPHGFPGIDG